MVLFVLRKRILQTSMRSHPVGLDVWFWSEPSSTSLLHVCEHRRLWWDCADVCAGSPEPLLVVAYVIRTIISWAGSFLKYQSSRKMPMTCFTYFMRCTGSLLLMLHHCQNAEMRFRVGYKTKQTIIYAYAEYTKDSSHSNQSKRVSIYDCCSSRRQENFEQWLVAVCCLDMSMVWFLLCGPSVCHHMPKSLFLPYLIFTVKFIRA